MSYSATMENNQIVFVSAANEQSCDSNQGADNSNSVVTLKIVGRNKMKPEAETAWDIPYGAKDGKTPVDSHVLWNILMYIFQFLHFYGRFVLVLLVLLII